MFNADFFPTPAAVISQMLEGLEIAGRVILEPSAGKGDIVAALQDAGVKNVIACEINEDLQAILKTKCNIIAADFLSVTSEQVSHIDTIVMNPPFSADEPHILHAYQIAPAACEIIALCNYATIQNPYTTARKQLTAIIEKCGTVESLGNCFEDAERKTGVNVGLIKIRKPGEKAKNEFEGFFMDEEPEEAQEVGLMSYNVVRDLVNRYIGAVKIFDEQIETAVKLNNLCSSFHASKYSFLVAQEDKPKKRNEFKKELQKSAWRHVFNKMNMTKHATRGLKEDINKFVEQQTHIPFTMRNIYRMIEIVIGTTSQRMDKSLLEVFERVTAHHHENRFNIKGWKTNGHFLVGRKFILPYMINPAKEYGYTSDSYNSLRSSYDGTIPDLEKALCFISGEPYEDIKTVNGSINRNTYGEWYDSHFFRYKGYKNGNMHFEFKSTEVWGKFNQHIAKLKGYPLFEYKQQTAYQERQTGRAYQEKKNPAHNFKPTVLFEI